MFLSNRRPNNWVSFAENSKQAHIAKAFGSSASVVFASVIVKLDKVENIQQNIGVFIAHNTKSPTCDVEYQKMSHIAEKNELSWFSTCNVTSLLWYLVWRAY